MALRFLCTLVRVASDARSGGDAFGLSSVQQNGLKRDEGHIYISSRERNAVRACRTIRLSHSPLLHCVVHHRPGLVQVGEASIAIAVYSPHRMEAFIACE